MVIKIGKNKSAVLYYLFSSVFVENSMLICEGCSFAQKDDSCITINGSLEGSTLKHPLKGVTPLRIPSCLRRQGAPPPAPPPEKLSFSGLFQLGVVWNYRFCLDAAQLW